MRQTHLAEPVADGEDARTLLPLQAAAITAEAIMAKPQLSEAPWAAVPGSDAARVFRLSRDVIAPETAAALG